MALFNQSIRRKISWIVLLVLGLANIQIANGLYGFGTFFKQLISIPLMITPFTLTLGDITGVFALMAFFWTSGYTYGGVVQI